jgi:hypothetical protein
MLARRALTREREWRSAESSDHRGGTFGPSYAAALVDEIANVLDGWPGVRIERRSDGAALVRYGQMELGVLGRDRGVVHLLFSRPEHDQLVEHGDAEPADSTPIPTWSAAASWAGGRDRRARGLRPSVRSSRYETMSAEAAETVTTRAARQAALETVGRDRGPRGRGAIERLSLCEMTPAPKAADVFSSSRHPRTALAYGECRSARVRWTRGWTQMREFHQTIQLVLFDQPSRAARSRVANAALGSQATCAELFSWMPEEGLEPPTRGL